MLCLLSFSRLATHPLPEPPACLCSPCQQHIAFWDRDADGLITPADVYVGFR